MSNDVPLPLSHPLPPPYPLASASSTWENTRPRSHHHQHHQSSQQQQQQKQQQQQNSNLQQSSEQHTSHSHYAQKLYRHYPPRSSTAQQQQAGGSAEPSSYELFMRRLPTDLVLRILDFLCIADIHCLRRAGAGAGPGAEAAALHALLRDVMRRRVRRLQGIWGAMTLEDVEKNFTRFLPRGWPQPRAQERVLPLLRAGVPKQDPDDFVALRWRRGAQHHHARPWPPRPTFISKMADVLHLSYLDAAAATAIATEMPDVTRLNVRGTTDLVADLHDLHHDGDSDSDSSHGSNNNHSSNNSNNNNGHNNNPWGAPFRDVPAQLAQCTQLRALEVAGTFDTVPEPILQLPGLVELTFGWDCQIKELPDDIGARLPLLRFVELQGCPISSLPQSLLDAVERNRFRKWPKLPGEYGIIVSEHHFPPGYWSEILGKERPPRYPPSSHSKKGLVFRADP